MDRGEIIKKIEADFKKDTGLDCKKSAGTYNEWLRAKLVNVYAMQYGCKKGNLKLIQ